MLRQRRRRNLAPPPSPACLQVCHVLAAHFLDHARPGLIFSSGAQMTLSKPPKAPGTFHWPSPSVPHLSSAYINRFSAPFTSSGAAVVKSALCHVHFKYLMLLEEMRSATVRPQPGAFLGCARMEMFPNFKCATPPAEPLENLSNSCDKWRS